MREPPAPQEPEPERGDIVFRIAILVLVGALVARFCPRQRCGVDLPAASIWCLSETMMDRLNRALRGNIVEVVKPGPHAAEIARAVRRPPRIGTATQQAIDRLRAEVSRITDPYPEPHWSSVAAHFASASSNPRKLDILAARRATRTS